MPPREGNDVGCNKMPAARGNGMQLGHYLGVLICPNIFVIPSKARDLGSCLHYRCHRRGQTPKPSLALRMTVPKHSYGGTLLPWFASRTGQGLHLFLVDLDLARLFHLAA